MSLILALAFAAAFPASVSRARALPPEFATNDQVRLTFTATVFAEPCTVDNGTAVKLTLPLARHSQMQAANSHSPAGAFTLNLSKCPPGMSKVKMAIQGSPHADDAKVFANTLSGGKAAQNVGIRIWSGADPSNEAVRWFDGAVRTFEIDKQRNVKVDLNADMFTPKGKASNGDVQSVVRVTMSYE
ncbi:fimbrial protein [Candidatus Glomeribacter gigasporarum]|uniref:fimbrial protein n=1 Tax=Candidatus Glomeribacter gigasporarum TaxID=132144 RepID=UPI001315A280|nr:fimbrial protein [Candidatus Glomeribacter gigasporarum]